MTETAPDGLAYLAGGTSLGAVTAAYIGNVGVVGSLGGVALGGLPLTGAGMIAGAATYGAMQAIHTGDPVAIGAIGVGMIGGITVSSTVGGLGVAGSFGAFGVGMGAMATLGGVVGLGVYGAVKMLDQGIKETPAQAVDRMADKIAWQEAYVAALIELEDFLTGNDIKRKFRALEVEDELERLKAELQRQQATTDAMTVSPPETTPGKATFRLPPSLQPDVEAATSNVWLCTQTLKHHVGAVNSIAISPDSQTAIIGGDDGNSHLFDIATGDKRFTLFGREPVLSVAVHPQGQTVVYGGLDQVISHWRVAPKTLLPSFLKPGTPHSHNSFIYALAFTPDGHTLVSGSADNTIRIWNYDQRSVVEKLRRTLNGHTDTVFSIAVSPDGKTLVSGSADRTIRVWELASWADPRIFRGHTRIVNAVAINPDGETIASGSNDNTVRLWQLKTGAMLAVLTGHTAPVTSIAFSPRGGTLISSGQDGTIRFWQRDSNLQWQPSSILPGKAPIAISPDGSTLISSYRDNTIKVWKLKPFSP